MTANGNSRQVVLDLLNHRPVDRVPCFSGVGNVTTSGLKQYGYRFPEIHVDAEKMANSALATYEQFGFECVVAPFDMGVEAEALGCQVNYYDDGSERILYPTIKGKLSEKIADLKLTLPADFSTVGRIPIVLEAIRRVRAKVGDQVAIGSWVLAPYTLAGQIVDLNDLLKNSYKKPAMINDLLSKLADAIIQIVTLYRQAGADFITVREMGATSDVISPRMFGTLILPHLQKVFAALPRPTVLHICGDTNQIMEHMAASGADALSVDQKNDLAASRTKVPQALLFGNIDPYGLLVQGNPETIDAGIRKILANGPDAVWPGCDIWPEVPPENFRALMTTMRQHGAKGGSPQ
jgi:[methyl-Co(III) methanol-specific corrinoid protein]:coenzyme M methyltransferase